MPKDSSRRARPLVLIAAVVVLFILFRFGLNLLVEWYWFQEVGLETVFRRILRAQSTVGITAAAVSALWIWVHAWWALRRASPIFFEWFAPTGQLVRLQFPERVARNGAKIASLAIGIFVLLSAVSHWGVFLAALYGKPFGRSDPILGYDIGFYIFRLPAMRFLIELAWILLILAAVVAAVLYALQGELVRLRGRFLPGPRARRHLFLLLAAAALLSVASAQMRVFGLMTSTQGLFTGPGYADIYGWLPLLRIWIVVGLAAAVLFVVHAFRPVAYLGFGVIGAYALLVAASWIYPTLLQRLGVVPNEPVRESPFIGHNIAATRAAFNLESVEERELTGDSKLTASDIERNDATIENIRLWDHGPLLDTFSQIQEIRTYYDFIRVDNDRYRVGEDLRQMMLSPRELSVESLPNRSWQNVHLAFTHGFGLTLGPVNRVTSEGLPVLLIRDIPPQSEVPGLRVERPQIYYGELTDQYAIVRTRQQEFDYPAGDDNAYTTYSGTGGVPLGTLWRRIVFSIVFAAPNIFLSRDVSAESRILYHRNIQARAMRAVPFLLPDGDPYMVISSGNLFWIQDAYTVSSDYPYSQYVELARPVGNRVNYIRNSVKIVVDAYHGSVQYYVADPADPILQTYAAIFPGVFQPIDGMPSDIRQHVRYPEDLFAIQTQVYATYHMKQPDIFYKKEDQWEIPTIAEGNQPRPMVPYYTIMKLPQETGEEFILMLPLTPRRKDNLAAWMIARSDAEHYGRLVAYRFPRQKLIYGPRQINARINQDPEISRQVSLWDQRGSAVILGTLLVIPIEKSLIYVRPLYLRAETGKIPELKRVIVAYESQIAMEETLERSLARIFGSQMKAERAPAPSPAAVLAAETTPAASAQSQQQLLEQAAQHYDRALRAQREGNWALYGEEVRKLGEVLQRMREQK